MEVTTEINKPEYEHSDDDDIPTETHNKLLNAVSLIYKKQRIEKPKRREPTSQISEFNLSHKTRENDRKLINVHELVSALNAKASHNEIKKKVNKMQRKSQPLPKPMEKLHADKLRRKMGYNNIRNQLNRWEAIVERNRSATQLRFPLENEDKVTVKDSHDFLKTFKEPTELEKEVAAVLQMSETAQEERQKEEKLFPLSLEEIIERRKMIAHMRARESYRMAKGVRQNKIKSKKYHRILKRERMKKELKDFEILQKTNPEAALEKLEKIERARAEERISLRHRNTGKWARSRAIRAKYDTEARAQLAEQLAKSRDLTKKLQSGIHSSSDEEDNNEEEVDDNLQIDPTNPWKTDSDKNVTEIDSFVHGFKQFQKEKKQEKVEDSQQKLRQDVDSNGIQDELVCEKQIYDKSTDEECVIEQKLNSENSVSDNCSATGQLIRDHSLALNTDDVEKEGNDQDNIKEANSLETDDVGSNGDNFEEAGDDTVDLSDDDESIKQLDSNLNSEEDDDNEQDEEIEEDLVSDSLKPCVSKVDNAETQSFHGIKIKAANRTELVLSNLSSDKVSPKVKSKTPEVESENKESENESPLINSKKRKMKRKSLINQSGTWEVCTVNTHPPSDHKVSESNVNSIEKLFDNVENKLKNSLTDHINKLKSVVNSDNDKSSEKNVKKTKYHADLSFNSKIKRPDTDTSLIEVASEGISTGENDVKRLMEIYDSNKSKDEEISDIDPHKYLPVKPKKLNSGQLDIVEDEEVSENDDDETNEEHQKLNLEEAFADDDVVDEFRREKEEEVENAKPKDIDLNLPGWGHWAGHNMDSKSNKKRLKRKNRRLIIKFPEIPRKDSKKDHVIINEDVPSSFKKHMVHDLPFPFKSVKDYETSIRAPIGNNWVPQSAFMKLIQPSVVTKLGSIIEPMSETELVKVKRRKLQKSK